MIRLNSHFVQPTENANKNPFCISFFLHSASFVMMVYKGVHSCLHKRDPQFHWRDVVRYPSKEYEEKLPIECERLCQLSKPNLANEKPLPFPCH